MNTVSRRHFVVTSATAGAAAAAATLGLPGLALAQGRTLRILVGFPPGGGTASMPSRLRAVASTVSASRGRGMRCSNISPIASIRCWAHKANNWATITSPSRSRIRPGTPSPSAWTSR